ncbi:Uu.00g121540.m01.CDS01 [Anthostomella pinea]|uniref:Uu.00g121540.m01.CDS01 n=1 Tax=Anthostomella pinea TaxID=933095 RepID=A0AAI8VH11_9PEZI|nr:Uu.00g121540.m01.CDS01 [Anthostomella pinea]
MLLLFLLTTSLVWTTVLTFFIVRDYRLLLHVARWSTSIYLIVFGIFAAEVLREGLVVNGHAPLHWDVRIAWTSWFVLVACSVFDWRFLVPAVVCPVWFLSFPEKQQFHVMDIGLFTAEIYFQGMLGISAKSA